MELKNQVVSLELAKRLKELGVKQHAHFWWSLPNPEKAHSNANKLGLAQASVQLTHMHYGINFDEYAAFTVAELGELLPKEYPGVSESILVHFGVEGSTHIKWYSRYEDDYSKRVLVLTHGDTEANTRAALLIYLIENKLITL